MVRPRPAPPGCTGGDCARGIGQPGGRTTGLHPVGREPATAGARAHCGVTLVTRSPGARSVELTEAGTQLLAHAGAIAGHLESARADLAAFADGRTGERRIGAVPSAAAALVPALATELRSRAPRLTLAVSESYFPAELLDRLTA